MNYSEQLAELTMIDPALGNQVATLPNLEAILRWLPGAKVSLTDLDLVQQDEYSYDLLLPLPDSRWLVFGVT